VRSACIRSLCLQLSKFGSVDVHVISKEATAYLHSLDMQDLPDIMRVLVAIFYCCESARDFGTAKP